MRMFLYLFMLSILLGCKVRIDVPVGGSVSTDSGNYSCGENSSCVIDVEDTAFNEVFNALPNEGYRFVGWRAAQAHLCGKNGTTPCSFSTAPLALLANAPFFLAADVTFYLVPIFEPSQAAADLQVSAAEGEWNDAPSATPLDDGGFLVAWTRYDELFNGSIVARRLDAQGASVGAEFQVNQLAGNNSSPVALNIGEARVAIVWVSYDENFEGDLYARIFSENGEAIGDQFRVNDDSPGDQWDMHAGRLEDGSFVVAWESVNYSGPSPDGDGSGLFARQVSSDGTLLGEQFQVNTTTALDSESPSVAGLADGGFVIVWTDGECCEQGNGRDGSGNSVLGQRYDSNASPVGPEFQVNTTTDGDQIFGNVLALPSGGFAVFWDHPGSDVDEWGDSPTDIDMRIFDAAGNPVSGELPVNSSTSGEQANGGATALVDGSILAVWDSDGDGPPDSFARKFDSLGAPLGAEFQVNDVPGTTVFTRAITLVGGGVVVTWSRDGLVYAALLSESGNR